MPSPVALAAVLVVPLALVGQLWLVPTIKLAGLLYRPLNLNNQGCTKLTELQGCEDMYFHPTHPSAYFACSPPSARATFFPAMEIFPSSSSSSHSSAFSHGSLYHLSLPSHTVTRLTLSPPMQLNTHGLDAVTTSSRGLLLFAINHRFPDGVKDVSKTGADSTVDVFETVVGSAEAKLVRTVRDPLIRTPNSVVAKADGKGFWISNDFRTKGDWRRKYSFYKFPSPSDIVYCDISGPETRCKVAIEGLLYPNGLAKGPGNTLYNAGTYAASLRSLEIQADNTLVLSDELQLPHLLDNVHVRPSGSVLLPYIPSAVKFVDHGTVKDISKRGKGGDGLDLVEGGAIRPPSEVIRVRNETGEAKFYGKKYKVETIFADDGSIAPGTTGVAVHGKTLYLTGPFAPWVAACELPKEVDLS